LLKLQGVYETDERISRDAKAFLEAVRTCSPFALGGLTITPGALSEIETVHRTLITMHLEKDLKSARVLREMRRP
jgi:hypothetical protein